MMLFPSLYSLSNVAISQAKDAELAAKGKGSEVAKKTEEARKELKEKVAHTHTDRQTYRQSGEGRQTE
jgi:hypothetical protein